MDNIEFIQSISVLRMKKGDTIIIKSPDLLRETQVRHITEVFEKHFPDYTVMILDGGLDMGVLRK